MNNDRDTTGLRRVSSLVLGKPSRILQEINSNALLVDWEKRHPTAHVKRNRSEFFQYLNSDVLRDVPIDYLEFGVNSGRSIREWARLNTSPESRFIGFDTFEGLPEVWDRVRGTFPERHFDRKGQLPKIDDARVTFVKGLFQETLPGFLCTFTPRHRLVVHNDSDLYSSTLYLLTQLDPLLIPGAIVIFDEFFSSSHEFQAFYDYARSYYRKTRVVASVGNKPYSKAALEML